MMNASVPRDRVPDPHDIHDPADGTASTVPTSLVPGTVPDAGTDDEDDGYEPV